MKLTTIEWTATYKDDGSVVSGMSSNPLRYRTKEGRTVWACIKKSSGCANCYSEQIAMRFDRGKVFNAANMEELTPFIDDEEIKHILTAKTIGGQQVSGKRCFLGDMTDIFGEWVPFELIDKIFAAMAMRPDVTFQILTKRPKRMAEYLNYTNQGRSTFDHRWKLNDETGIAPGKEDEVAPWPLPNCWFGTSVENQATADERIPHLLEVPAAVRFLSCEPLLGPVNLAECAPYTLNGDESNPGVLNAFNGMCHHPATVMFKGDPAGTSDGISWVIVGGESGPNARPMLSDWAYSLRDQCELADVPFFFKQFSEWVDFGCREFGRVAGKIRIARMDGTFYPEGGEPHDENAPAISMSRIGVKKAGRLLGMKEYSEFPLIELIQERLK